MIKVLAYKPNTTATALRNHAEFMEINCHLALDPHPTSKSTLKDAIELVSAAKARGFGVIIHPTQVKIGLKLMLSAENIEIGNANPKFWMDATERLRKALVFGLPVTLSPSQVAKEAEIYDLIIYSRILSDKEKQIFPMVLENMKDRDIALELNCPTSKANSLVYSICKKLGFRTRVEMVAVFQFSPQTGTNAMHLHQRMFNVLKMTAAGKNLKEISAELHTTPLTIRNMIFDLCDRFNLSSKSELIAFFLLNENRIKVAEAQPITIRQEREMVREMLLRNA